MTLEAQIEAVLFWRAEPVAIKKLAQTLDRPEDEIKQTLNELELKLRDRGVRLIFKDDEAMLGTAPEAADLIKQLTTEEFSRDLGKASLETLTIVLYKGPLTRAEIDYIRGVNSSFILRHLSIRGLVERIPNPKDARSFLYRPTFDLFQHLGLSKIEELPEYGELISQLENLDVKSEEHFVGH